MKRAYYLKGKEVAPRRSRPAVPPTRQESHMNEPFYALIVPRSGGVPTHPIELPPPGIWGGGNVPMPSPPIYLVPPDAIAPGVPTHPIYIPVFPAHPIVLPPGSLGGGKPTHPIVLPPLSIWGGGNVPMPAPPIVIPPGAVEPGVPTQPIYIPPIIWGGGNVPMPNPPIYIPGGPPLQIWGGGNVPMPAPPIWIPSDNIPAHPIVIPPDTPPELPPPSSGTPTHPISGGGVLVYWIPAPLPEGTTVYIPLGGASPKPPTPAATKR